MRKPSASRRVWSFAALMASALVIAGCGSADGAAADNRIELVIYNNESFAEALPQTFDTEFTDRTGVTVDIINTGADTYESVDQRVLADVAAGRPPELALVGLDGIRSYAESDRAVPLDPFIEQRAAGFDPADFDEALLALGVRDGATVAIPYGVSTYGIYYNADIFRQAGLDPERPPTTFSETRRAAEAIVSSGAARFGAIYGNDHSGNWAFQNFLASNGGQLMNEDETEFTFDDPPGVDVVQFWADLYGAGLGESMTRDQMRDAFDRGDLGMMFDSLAGAQERAEDAGFDARTAPFAIPDGGQRAAVAGGAAVVMLTTDPATQEAAWVAITEMLSRAGQSDLSSTSGYTPLNQEADRSNTEPLLQAGVEQLQFLAPWYEFPGPNSNEIGDILEEEINRALRGDKPAQDALADAAREAQRLLP